MFLVSWVDMVLWATKIEMQQKQKCKFGLLVRVLSPHSACCEALLHLFQW
jgi:hypothetical protein